MSSTVTDEAIALLRAGVDALLQAALPSMDGPGLVTLLEELEVQRRRLDAVDVRLVTEVDQRRVAGEFGRSSTADLLTLRLRVAPGEARRRVDRAGDPGPRRELTGAPLAPILPATSAALHAGDLSAAHATVIAKAIDSLPADIACEASGPAETYLVEAARHEDPARLRQSAQLLLERLDPDGRRPREDDDDRRRGLTLFGRGNGASAPRGLLPGDTTAIWRTILDALSAPHVAKDGASDDRTPAQRRADAFKEAGLRLLRAGTLPESGGTLVTVVATTTDHDLDSPAGLARTAHGDLISLRRLLALGDSEIRYTTMTVTGEVLHHGRAKRLATPPQRRALTSRDGGCCFPGCTRPAAWTEAHHVIPWLDGGPTDIDNLCLVCPFHHRLLDHGDWHVIMIDGRPHWLPPPWIDPEQAPILNTANHLPDIDFGVWRSEARPDTG